MFVMMGGFIGDADGSGAQGRVAAYVVSGIGFIGGGVILKEGFSIRGLNTDNPGYLDLSRAISLPGIPAPIAALIGAAVAPTSIFMVYSVPWFP